MTSKSSIVISGISGRYPESKNLEEFWSNLMIGTEMCLVNNKRRWIRTERLPDRTALIPNESLFDAEFFKTSHLVANQFYSTMRILHEVIYEAFLDAGIHDWTNIKTGLFLARCDVFGGRKEDHISDDIFRLANHLNITGPIIEVDTACASSFAALDCALLSIRSGQCEQAIVAGCNFLSSAALTQGFLQLNMICKDGYSKCLNSKADGFARSESVVAIIIQKESNAKRIYSYILDLQTNCDGYTEEGITYPSYEAQLNLFNLVIQKLSLDPLKIDYIEGHITGTQAGDMTEGASLLSAFRANSNRPLMIGCLKSNIGHSEASSGLNAISKVAKIFQTGLIPANVNYSEPNPKIEGLINGILVPVLSTTHFNGKIIPINSIGFGGVNSQAILVGSDKQTTAQDKILSEVYAPRLINFCNRTLKGLQFIEDFISKQKGSITKYLLALINDVSKIEPSSGFNFRGYLLLDSQQSILFRTFNEIKDSKSPCFIFMPMFNISSGSLRQLLKIPFIVERLKSLNVKLASITDYDLIETLDSFDYNITSFLIFSTAIQITLHDFLTIKLNIKPQKIIGHSIGTIAACYADGCLTDLEALSVSYCIGQIFSNFPNDQVGLMAYINLPWNQLETIKPNNIEIASHESKQWTKITGSKEPVEDFLSQMSGQVDIKIINTRNVAFNSSILEESTKTIETQLSKHFKNSRSRSSSLVLTTATSDNSNEKLINEKTFAKLLTSKLFLNEQMEGLPSDSIRISIGASEKDFNPEIISLIADEDVIMSTYQPVIMRLYQSIGDLYLNGLNPSIENLYHLIHYPVPRETQSIGHLIQWKHETNFQVHLLSWSETTTKIVISLVDPVWLPLFGHVLDGHILLPAMGYLFFVIKFLSLFIAENDKPFEFYQIRFHRAIKLGKAPVELIVKLKEDFFEVSTKKDVCATGKFKMVEAPSIEIPDSFEKSEPVPIADKPILMKEDFYKELRTRGYDYTGSFQGVEQAFTDGSGGLISETDHWTSFADSCLQITLLFMKCRKLLVPTSIEYVYVDMAETKSAFNELRSDKSNLTPKLKVSFDKSSKIGMTNGFIIKGVQIEEIPRRVDNVSHKVWEQIFSPFDEKMTLCAEYQDKSKKYMQYCLSCIEILKSYQRKKTTTTDDPIENLEKEKIKKLTANSSNTLLRVLFESITNLDAQKDQSNEVSEKSIRTELRALFKKYADDLLKDQLLFEPLSYLYSHMMNIIMENIKTREISVLLFNFIAIPSEIEKNQETNLRGMNNNYHFTYASIHDDNVPGTNVIRVNPNSDKKIGGSQHDIIITRDRLTYLLSTLDETDCQSEYSIESILNVVYNSLKAGGFFIILYRTELTTIECKLRKLLGKDDDIHFDETLIRKCAQEIGFVWICCKELNGFCSILLRRPFPVNDDQNICIIRVGLDNYDWIDEIKKASGDKNDKIWLIGGGYDNGLIGLTRSLVSDPSGYNVRCFYDPTKNDDDDIIIPGHVMTKDLTINIVDQLTSKVGCYFLNPIDVNSFTVDTPHCYADLITKGDLSSFRWLQSFHSKWKNIPNDKLKLDVEMITCYYGAVNFKDILVSTGRVPIRSYPTADRIENLPLFGMEFSGISASGERILGLGYSGSIASTLMFPKDMIKINVPDHWTLAEAATVPIVYLTAYYGLIVRGNLQFGESVLIHAGSGGVGQAAISICLARGCQVFTTVGSKEKRDFIKNRFHSIDDDHIGDSRSTSFEDMILKMTDGRGVDVVLNSLSDDKWKASIRCLAEFGRFIDIAKYDIIQDTHLEIQAFDHNKTFHAVCIAWLLDDVYVHKIPARIEIKNSLLNMLEAGIKSGEVKPLPSTIFEKDRIEDAFRFMATGKHIGKVLIKMRDEINDDDRTLKLHRAIGQTFFDLNKCYIITGGLGGLGLETAYWMCQRGATNFVLTSRSGIKTSYQQYMIDKIRDNSLSKTNVVISTEDCLTFESAERLIKLAESIAMIGGIFHYALVLSDALFENQTVESFNAVGKPKAIACRYLDQLTRSLTYKVDYFVCASSLAAQIGSPGQANYCFANSSMEQICIKRRLDGLHGLAIQWSLIGDVGIVAENRTGTIEQVLQKFNAMRIPTVLKTTDKLLLARNAVFMPCSLTNQMNYSSIAPDMTLKKAVFHILGIEDESRVEPGATLSSLGLDSLMAVEIQQQLETRYDHSMSAQEIRNLKVCELDGLSEKFGDKK